MVMQSNITLNKFVIYVTLMLMQYTSTFYIYKNVIAIHYFASSITTLSLIRIHKHTLLVSNLCEGDEGGGEITMSS